MRFDLQTCGRNTTAKGPDGLLKLVKVTTITVPQLRVYVITSTYPETFRFLCV